VASLDLLSKYLLNIELRFGAVLYSNLGNKNCNAGHINCSGWPQVPHPWHGCFHIFEQLLSAFCNVLLFLLDYNVAV